MLDIFQWGSWLSVMKYSAEILVANEFQELNFTCPIEPGKICYLLICLLYKCKVVIVEIRLRTYS